MKKHRFLKIALSFLLTASTVAAQTETETTQQQGRLILKNLHEKRFKTIGGHAKKAGAKNAQTILSNNAVNSSGNGTVSGKTLAATGPQRVVEANVFEIKKTPMLSQKLSATNKAWMHACKQKALKLNTLLDETFLVAQRYRELPPQKQSSTMKKNVEAILTSLTKTKSSDETETLKLGALKKVFSDQKISDEEIKLFEASSHSKEKLPFAENLKSL